MERGSGRARFLTRILDRPEWILATTLLGTNLAVVTINAIATLYVADHFGKKFEFLTILVTAPVILIFGEAIPKAFGQRFSDSVALQLVYPLRIISWMMSPLVAVIAAVARVAVRISGIRPLKKTPYITREELELILQASNRQPGVKDLERRMIDRIFSFSNRQAREIMIPLVKVVAIQQEATLHEAVQLLAHSGFSRLPVYRNNVTDIVGWINHYDLLLEKDRSRLVKEVMRNVAYIPAAMLLDRLLIVMQMAHWSIAAILDEHGGAIGIVTLEDVIEEVVGDIEDEYDQTSPLYRRVDPHRVVVESKITIRELNDVLASEIPPGDYETLAGFLMERMQRIPAVGEEFRYKKLLFRVTRGTARTIHEVEIQQL